MRRGKLRRTLNHLSGRSLGKTARKQRERSMVRVMAIAGRVLGLAAALLVIVSFSVQAWRVGSANYNLHREIDQVEDQNRQLSSDTVKLREDIILSRNPEYLVPLIHEQLGLTRPREVFIEVAPQAQK